MSAQSVVYLAALSICIANLLWLAWRDWTDKDEPLSRGAVLAHLVVALVPVANVIYAACLVVCHVEEWLDRPVLRRRQ